MHKTTSFAARSSIIASVCLLIAANLSPNVLAQSGGSYDLSWSTVDGGGSISSGGSYTLSGTIGQPDARNHPQAMSGGTYRLTGGFWVIPECPVVPGDYDGDCDVDQADCQVFEVCASSPGIPEEVDCSVADFDSDSDVDQSDFAAFQRCISGENTPADADCRE